MPVLLLLSSLGCTNSGLGRPTPTGDTAPAGLTDCPWVGSWTLDELTCGAFAYEAWPENYTSAEMEIEQEPAGGCNVRMTLVGKECQRSETWHFAAPVGINVDVTRNGISDCEPNRCIMESGQPECKNGELAAPTAQHAIDGSITGKLEAVDLLADTASECPLDVITVWTQQRR